MLNLVHIVVRGAERQVRGKGSRRYSERKREDWGALELVLVLVVGCCFVTGVPYDAYTMSVSHRNSKDKGFWWRLD